MRLKWMLAVGVLVLFVGCDGDDGSLNQNQRINEWTYVNMDYWYFWTGDMPDKSGTNQYPADFYESLLVPEDNFSFYYEDYVELINLLNGVSLESGFEYKLYLEGESGVIMQIQ